MKKGFTLIELLAVIVILAIIALIATPIVLRIIDNSKTSAVKRSAELYLDAVEQAIMKENLKGKFSPSTCIIQSDGDLLCDEREITVELSGEKPTGGTITLEDGKITNVQDMILGGYVLKTDENGGISMDKASSSENDKEEYKDAVLNGADPELYSGLTPIKYDGSSWVVADTSEEWYNYTKQEWANAVILDSGASKKAGDTLDLSTDVMAMFVWIPRYEYKIDGDYGKDGVDEENPGEIEVNFIPSSQETASNNYHIHPAFKFGNTVLNGIWIGKFETSWGGDENIAVLPNSISIYELSLSQAFEKSKSLSSYLTGGNSHMTKNSEWGAAAYLSQSIYGKYGNDGEEVYINSCEGQTGFAGDTADDDFGTCSNAYDTLAGQNASTTGNIYGVYDMKGLYAEYAMGYYIKAYTDEAEVEGLPWGSTCYEDNAQFTSEPDRKYYDAYETVVEEDESERYICNGGECYGHSIGTNETSGWYGAYNSSVSPEYPWTIRDGQLTIGVPGLFSLDAGNGMMVQQAAFRVVITKN